MKIDGPGKAAGAQGVSKAGKSKKTGGAAFSGMLDETEETAAASTVSGPSAIGALDTLLSLQEAGDAAGEPAKKAKRRATALLDELDKLRIGLLSGGIPKTALQHLTHIVSHHRDKVMDPALVELLDEIDLRAQVELAKHGG